MTTPNLHYADLKDSYLFYNIAQKTKAYLAERPGEKLLEELLMSEEGLQKTKNKLIYIGKQIEIDMDKFINQLWNLKNAASANDDQKAIKALHEIVPTFTTPEEFNRTVKMPAV